MGQHPERGGLVWIPACAVFFWSGVLTRGGQCQRLKLPGGEFSLSLTLSLSDCSQWLPHSAAGGQGLAPLAAHLHGLKLKLGVYTSGHQCCSPKDGTDGSEGKEVEDAQQFADWGIDYIKDDDCGSSADHFTKMRGQYAIITRTTPSRAASHACLTAWLGTRRRDCEDWPPNGLLHPLAVDTQAEAREWRAPGPG